MLHDCYILNYKACETVRYRLSEDHRFQSRRAASGQRFQFIGEVDGRL